MVDKDKPGGGKVITYGGGGCLFLMLIVAIAGSISDTARTPDYAKPRVTPKPTPVITPDVRTPDKKLEDAIEKILGDNLEEFIYSLGASAGDSLVAVRWLLHDNFTLGMTRDSAKTNTLDILKEISASGLDPSVVRIFVSAEYQDQYGNPFMQKVIRADYTAATIGRINFENMRTENAWSIADSSEIHRDFQGK